MTSPTIKNNSAYKLRNVLYTGLFLVLVLFVWVGMSFLAQPKAVELPAGNGYYDLSGRNFTDTVYRAENDWESWPERLYTPQDFANGSVIDSPRTLSAKEYKSISYATHRLRLTLPAGETYGISMLTSEYAMRLYVDGVEIDSVGTPGTTRENTEHRAQERTYYFTTKSGQVEIIVQAANFVHAKGGAWPPRFYIGTANNITRWDDASLAVNYMIIGCLATAFLYHLGLFLRNRKRKIVLLFAFCCLLLAFLNKKLILMFWPEYNWQVGIRIEYLLHFLSFAALFFFLDRLNPKLLNKWIARSYYTLAGGYCLTLLLDSTVFTGLLIYFEIVSVLMIAYVLIAMAFRLKSRKPTDLISFIGILVLGLLGANDVLYYRGIEIIEPISGQFFMAPVGMVFFVFCYALVLSEEYAETEKSMHKARANEQLLAAENASLDRINRMKSDLMETISHEARTPLAVLASYSGLVAMELRDKGVDAETAVDLDKIAFEAKRVANLIDGMKRFTLRNGEAVKMVPLEPVAIIGQTARLYRPILERKGVTLGIQTPESLPQVLGNPEELTQVLFNLLQNAKTYTESGSVTVVARKTRNGICLEIADTGTGIFPEILPHVFEKGISGSGGSGLGLHICKEIVEAHHGTIAIESKLGEGTAVCVTLPVYTEGSEHGA